MGHFSSKFNEEEEIERMKTCETEKETIKNGIEGLPNDVIYKILLRLPVKSLVRCKDVCMAWGNIVESPVFIKDHFTQSTQNRPLDNILLFNIRSYPNQIEFNSSSLDFNCGMGCGASVVPTPMDMDFLHDPTSFYEGLRVSNPCNGLLCFTDLCTSGYAWICNPTTREYLTLPKETNRNPTQLSVNSAGLGFDEASGVYKFVRLITNHVWCSVKSYEVRILTIGKDSWRSLGSFTDPIHQSFKYPCLITFAGGALHWLSKAKDGNDKKLISLNVGKEIFSVTQLPNFEDAMDYIYLREWMGCISLWRVGNLHTQIWVLKDYKNNKSWTEQLIMEYEYEIGRYLVPLGVLNNDEILLRLEGEYRPHLHIASYNIKRKKITNQVQVKGFSFQMPFTSSLVSIKDATQVSLTW